MSLFCNGMLEYLQNYGCCKNGIHEVSTEKDMMVAHRIYIYKNNTIFWTNILPWEIQDLIQHRV